MLSNVEKWMNSNDNVFLMHGCEFNVSRSPKDSNPLSITIDFDFNTYFCRLIFWESEQGHIEILDIDTENTFMDEGFDIDATLKADIPFMELFEKLSD